MAQERCRDLQDQRRPSSCSAKDPTVTHSMCGLRWCARADVIFDVPGRHVLDVEDDRDGRLIVTVESDQVETGCPSCGVIAASHRRRPRMLHDAPCLGRVTMVRWLKRMWRCREPGPGNILRHRHTREWPRKSATIRAPALSLTRQRHHQSSRTCGPSPTRSLDRFAP